LQLNLGLFGIMRPTNNSATDASIRERVLTVIGVESNLFSNLDIIIMMLPGDRVKKVVQQLHTRAFGERHRVPRSRNQDHTSSDRDTLAFMVHALVSKTVA